MDPLEQAIKDLDVWIKGKNAAMTKPPTFFMYRPKDFTKEQAEEIVAAFRRKFPELHARWQKPQSDK